MSNQTSALSSAPVRKKKIASLDRRKARAGWLFAMPFIVGFIAVYVPIIVESIKCSLYTYKLLDGGAISKTFVGFEHYQTALFGTSNFLQTLLTGLQEIVFDVPAILIFSLFIAVILNQKMAGRAVFRVIFFLPVVVSTGIMESIVTSSHSMAGAGMDLGASDAAASAGAAGEEGAAATGGNMALEAMLMGIFENLGFGQGLVTYIVGVVADIAGIVNRSGVQILIFLASLQSISPAIYESCQIDGATGWETFWKITFPMVSPMILVNAIYTLIDSFTTESNSVMRVINNAYVSAGSAAKHVSAAMGWMYFLLILIVVGIVAALFSAYVFYQRRD